MSTASHPDGADPEKFISRMEYTMWDLSLRLMVSDNGHIGMATKKAEKGDLICVLFGYSIPVLLRQKLVQGKKPTYALIGECFVHEWRMPEAARIC